MKILTVSIAAYNVEQYIKKALDSIIASKYRDLIEIFVVDDGGVDKTLDIAKEYQSKYPDVVIPVHKENGGYGTTINFSLERATGKFFKVLDGDDWFDSLGLDALMEVLMHSEEDIIVTNYYRYIEGKDIYPDYTHTEAEGTIIDLNSETPKDSPYGFGMWELVFKTQLLRDCNLHLPAHTLYTDRHYSTIPFACANTLRFTDAKVYCYRLGRDGQSMSPESQVNHYKERIEGSYDLCNLYASEKIKGNPRCKYLLSKVAASHAQTASVIRYMPKTKDSVKILKEYEDNVKKISKDIIKEEWKCGQFGKFLTLCRLTNYAIYWITPDRVLKKS